LWQVRSDGLYGGDGHAAGIVNGQAWEADHIIRSAHPELPVKASDARVERDRYEAYVRYM
jgi:hypothetical protein